MARKPRTYHQISYEDELRWVGILFQLVTTQIAYHQTTVSPPSEQSGFFGPAVLDCTPGHFFDQFPRAPLAADTFSMRTA